MHQPAGRPVDWVGGAHDRKTEPGAGLAAQLSGCRGQCFGGHFLSRVGLQPGMHLPMRASAGVHGLGDDTVRGDARNQGGPQMRGQSVVGADPAAPCGALAGVDDQFCLLKALDAVGDGRLGKAGPGGDLRPGQTVMGHQGPQYVLVRQAPQQLQGRLRRVHTNILVRTLA